MTLTVDTHRQTQPNAYTTESPAQVEDKAIQLQREMAEILREEIGLNDEFANAWAAAIVRGMRVRYGGQSLGRKGSIYIPAPSKVARNAAIRAEFHGTNAAEICRKYNIGKTRLYEIVNARA